MTIHYERDRFEGWSTTKLVVMVVAIIFAILAVTSWIANTTQRPADPTCWSDPGSSLGYDCAP